MGRFGLGDGEVQVGEVVEQPLQGDGGLKARERRAHAVGEAVPRRITVPPTAGTRVESWRPSVETVDNSVCPIAALRHDDRMDDQTDQTFEWVTLFRYENVAGAPRAGHLMVA